MIDFFNQSGFNDVRVFKDLIQSQNRASWDTQLHEFECPLHFFTCRKYFVQAFFDLLAMLAAICVIFEVGMSDPVFNAKQLAKLDPHIFGGRRHIERPIARLKHAVGADDRVIVTRDTRGVSQAQLTLPLYGQQADQAGEQ